LSSACALSRKLGGAQAGQILSGFALTLVVGRFAGLLWIRALGWLAKRRYVYMTTLAAVLALNWGVGALDGSGPIAVLAFGLVIGNRALVGKWSKVGSPKVFTDMAQFNGEVAFLVRSFFFVYLGLILDVSALTLAFILGALLVLVAIMAARGVAVWLMTVKSDSMRPFRRLLMATIPRGMTAAVVSTLPATQGIGGTEAFVAYAVVVIIVTNLLFTVGLFLFWVAVRQGWVSAPGKARKFQKGGAMEARTMLEARRRTLLAALKDRDIAARTKGSPDGIGDEEILQMLPTMVRQRQESIVLFEKGRRKDLAQGEAEEIAVIESFLPAQLNEDAIAGCVKEAIGEIGAKSLKDMGRVMALLRSRYAGQMDFAKASAILKAQLR
jgi:hypothetical protein